MNHFKKYIQLIFSSTHISIVLVISEYLGMLKFLRKHSFAGITIGWGLVPQSHITISYNVESYEEKAISFQLCMNDLLKLTQKKV